MGESGNDVADNCIRIFAARIVIGDYDTISQMLCSLAHLGALANVTVAATTKHNPEPAAAMSAQCA
jgi:hypothetical protein